LKTRYRFCFIVIETFYLLLWHILIIFNVILQYSIDVHIVTPKQVWKNQVWNRYGTGMEQVWNRYGTVMEQVWNNPEVPQLHIVICPQGTILINTAIKMSISCLKNVKQPNENK